MAVLVSRVSIAD